MNAGGTFRVRRRLNPLQDRCINFDGIPRRRMMETGPPASPSPPDDASESGSHFIREIVENDVRNDTCGGRVATRFPPEPNGYLHIGHAKSICLNFGLAGDFGGACNLRFDDTNPETEEVEYVESIKEDVRWLGFDWEDREYYASDYFDRLYAFAEHLIQTGHAYVDSQDEAEIRATRGTVTEPGQESLYRNRSVEENLDLFRRMKRGEYKDGEHVLRARGDMASSNMKMRDPLLYRIRHAHHYRSGDAWCIYPMYDFAHPLSDAIEEITHSLCTLEFDNNRELYDWIVDRCVEEPRPRQYEFARLNLDYTIMSKRKLVRLVREEHVAGWNDPRMPTLAGLRRRGVTPRAIRAFCAEIGVAKADNRIGMDLLDYTIRNDLNFEAPRVMCVLRPLKVTLINYPDTAGEELEASFWPHDVPREGSRAVPFGRELYIDRNDFREDPPKNYYRLAPGREVRLRYAYLIRCEEAVRDETGEVVELRCTYDPETRGGKAPDGRKVRGAIHWVSATRSIPVEVRLYDRLFRTPDPEAGEDDFMAHLNPDSLVTLRDAMIEPSVAGDRDTQRYQFEREGYFWRDPGDSSPERPVFNRIVPLRDTWAKVEDRNRNAGREPEAKAAAAPDIPKKRFSSPPSPTLTERIEKLSEQERKRFTSNVELGVSDDVALGLAQKPEAHEYFHKALDSYTQALNDSTRASSLANWVLNELPWEEIENKKSIFTLYPNELARLVNLVDEEIVSARTGKEVLIEMVASGSSPDTIIEKKGWKQVADPEALAPAVEETLDAFPDKVAAYRAGKKGLMGFFMGQVMQRTGGTAKPELARKLLEERLEG